jgi:hypothetical protein
VTLAARRVAVHCGIAAIALATAGPGRSLAGEPRTAGEVTAVRDTERPRPQLQAVRTTAAPDVDGDLRDAVWEQAAATTVFTQKFPDEAQPPSESTELRVLYDDRALYIAFNCVQLTAPVKGRLARRDRQVEADWVQVAIGDGSNAYEFSVNAAGVLSDGVRFNDTDYSGDWDGVWEAQVARHDRGWSAEMRIPLRIFRHAIGAPQWRFQARRYISHRQETDEWAFIPRSMAGEVSHYGWLSGVANVQRTNPLELLPYASTGTNWMDTNHRDYAVGYRATAGLDLAWRIGKDLTLDATINPDFAQVEADQVVLNLTTFETFVPEKRPFFLNGMAMFQMPRMELYPSTQTLFYTRRIGSVPDTPAVPPALAGDTTARVSAPEPSTIYAAAKLSGQLASGVTAGFVSALTGSNDVAVTSMSTRSSQLVAEPMALANVARIKVDAGGGATLGMLATALRRFDPGADYPTMTQPDGGQLQQCPDGSLTAVGARCFHDAYVAGLDGLWRSPSGTYVASAQAIVTSIQQGPPRTMLDGTVIKAGDTASAGRFYVAKEGGQWLGSVETQLIGRRVDYNDLGYLQRQNLVRILPYLGYRTLEPFWEIAETETHVYLQLRENLDGVTLLRGYYAGGKIRFKNFWTVDGDVFRYDVRNEDREVGDGTTLERPTGYGIDLNLATDPRKQLSAAISTETLVYSAGKSQGRSFTLGGEVTYQPLTRLELQLLPQLTLSSGVPRFVPGPRSDSEPRLLFGDLKAHGVGGTLRTSYTFTNRLTLQLYGQLLLTSENYSQFRFYNGSDAHPILKISDLMDYPAPGSNPNRVQTDLNLSAVLRWEFYPGSTLFLVYTRSQDERPPLDVGQRADLDAGALRTGPAHDALRLKLSYYWN